jgi:serine/threonine protein kinase
LGKGSFGRVYLALQKLTNRLVAIKSLAKTAFNDAGLKLKIQGEVKMMKTLTGHPFIISLLEVFENSKYVFFVTEYAANRDLLRALKKNGKYIFYSNFKSDSKKQWPGECSFKSQ